MTARKGLNTITSGSGVVLDIANKTLANVAIADFPALASTANAKGASLIGLEDSGSLFSATEVEAALRENRLLINSNSLGLGAFWECVDIIVTSNITLSGEQTLDGYATSGSRVLATAQTDATTNGIYVSAAGAWSRATDADASSEFSVNKTVCAMHGGNAGKTYAYTGDTEPNLGSDDLPFTFKAANLIPNGSITTIKLADDAVTTAKLLDANVTLAKMADNSVDSDQYVDGSIDAVHLASDSVITSKILDANITLAKMAANSVDSDQYVDGSIDTAHFAAGAVDNAAMASNSVDSDQYVDGSIDSEHFSAGAVNNAALATDAVSTAKILDDAITTDKLLDANVTLAKMAANSVDSDQYVDGSIDSEHFAAQAENNKCFVETIAFNSGAINTLIANNPSGSHVVEIMVNVTTAFDGGAALSIGVSGDTAGIVPSSDIDLSSTGLQVTNKFYTMGSTTNVSGFLSGTGMSQGSAEILVRRVL